MYADLKNVEFHTLLMQIMIKVQIKFCLLSFYLFIYFVTDFVDLSSALLFLPCAVLTPALQTSLCQIKSLRAASIPSTEFQFSLLVHERRAPGQSCGLPTTLPPPPKASVLVGRQRQQPTPAGGPEATAAATTADVATAEPPMKCCAKL